MNSRIETLRNESFNAQPSISIERALLETEFYQKNEGTDSIPVMRAKAFQYICKKKTLYIGDKELIVGERGPFPKAVPTFPELTCHSVEDLDVLNNRKMTRYLISKADIHEYERKVLPYWRGKSMRDRVFKHVPTAWQDAYRSGIFTEFMEQRAPGHTALDGTIYKRGMLAFQIDIDQAQDELDFQNDPAATDKAEELKAMAIACDAVMILAERHAELADKMAALEADSNRKAELRQISRICRRVPAKSPRNLWEAIQMYWFVHIGIITELNGWDAMSPGHLDQHLYPFFKMDLAGNLLDREAAKELIACLWIKFNNHPAPPKVGVTAKESGTYNDFVNINLGGVLRDGSNAVNEVSYIILEVLDELHLLQPQCNVQISEKTPDHFLRKACQVIRKGYGYPSVFNADAVILEQVRVGKSIEDAREGGCSGCIETGAFGKEAYILTGYLNVPKLLELAMNNGVDPLSGKRVGVETGDPMSFEIFDDLYKAFEHQLHYIVKMKIRVNNDIERMFAANSPAPFLSVVIQDCIKKGKDYYNGGPRYNTNYIQCCGIGTITDSLSAIKKHVYEDETLTMADMIDALRSNFKGKEALRLRLRNKTPLFGNDDDRADTIMQRVYASLFRAIDGRPNTKGGRYHLNMLSTTCHIYFGKMLGATPNGRFAEKPISDGTSPSHGADRHGPTAVIKSMSKMDQIKSGGTLLNQRFLPGALEKKEDIIKLTQLIRTYFKLKGHHIQFNVVDTESLRDAQASPDEYRDLLVRVAGYSDYFVDLDTFHQEEIIERTEHGVL